MNPRRPAALVRPLLPNILRVASYPFRLWNWKSAALSAVIRSLTYFFVALHHGRQAGLRAALLEAVYVCLTAGFYSAMQQGALRLEPRWAANLIVVAAVPMFAQSIDYALQHAAGTANAQATSLGMLGWGLLSAAFHLHLMRNGAMLMGEDSRSFKDDLRRMPRLVATFVAAPVVATLALRRGVEQETEIELVA